MLPTGTITFLFTDIEGNSTLWERDPRAMEAALEIHNAILYRAISAQSGTVFKIVGDEFQAAFPTASQALMGAVEAQRGLNTASWNELGPLKVRMGIHTGEAHLDTIGDEYAVSHTKNRASRVMSAGYGGQILLSQESADLCERNLPEGVYLKDLGQHRVKGLSRLEHLYQAVVTGLREDFPPLRTLESHPHNLPRQLTPFIGREQDILQVKALLADYDLVTLIGSGGVGKTRLSLRVSEDLVDTFADGIWYVELAEQTDPKLVVQTVALTLGLREEAGRSFQEAIEYFLKPRQTLLVLDNCEHLIEACARLAGDLLRSCPQLKLLASSREALGVAGETVYRVPSLSVPDSQEPLKFMKVTSYDAVRLFVERGKAVMPSFQVTEGNFSSIVRICERLDGIPLALELAAARLSVLNTEQLASRLERTFQLLTGGARTAVPRQQTLRATIDWSYQLLNEAERLLLRRLSVFVGGCSLEGAEAVCSGEGLEEGAILDNLTSLVNKSMVLADRVQGVKTRYHLLEMVRQYAREKLFDSGESEKLRNRHLDYFVNFTEQAYPQIHGAGRLEWTEYLKTEHTNIREALEWATTEPTTALLGLRIATAIADRFWFPLGFFREGEHWLQKGLQTAGDRVPRLLKVQAYYCLARLEDMLNVNQIKQVLEQCISLCREIGPAANSELSQAIILSAFLLDDIETISMRAEEAVQAARATEPLDEWTLAELLFFQSFLLLVSGHDDQAYAVAKECLQLVQSGDRWMAGGYWTLGIIQTRKNQLEQARENLEKGLELSLEIDDRVGVWSSLNYLAWHHRFTRQFHQAQCYYQDMLKLSDRYYRSYDYYFTLQSMGILFVESQKIEPSNKIPKQWLDAVRLFAPIKILKETPLRKHFFGIDNIDAQSALELLRTKIDPVTFEAAWKEGSLLAESLDEAVKYAQGLLEKYSFEDRKD